MTAKRVFLPDGLPLVVRRLPSEVVSCAEAASAKGIPLSNELKTLVLAEPGGEVLVCHLRGDDHLDLRAVKRIVGERDVALASPARLKDLGLGPGTVYPFSSTLAERRHLIDDSLSTLSFLSTNAGDLREFIVFDPSALCLLPNATTHRIRRLDLQLHHEDAAVGHVPLETEVADLKAHHEGPVPSRAVGDSED